MPDDFPKTKPFKDTIAYEGFKKLYKIATKNVIPSDPKKIIEMEERLINEDKLRQDAEKAKSHIKEIFKQRREAYKAVKRERRRKIKVFVKRLFGK